jgi:pimeloyl-ACP methyl ester carboxylesterase
MKFFKFSSLQFIIRRLNDFIRIAFFHFISLFLLLSLTGSFLFYSSNSFASKPTYQDSPWLNSNSYQSFVTTDFQWNVLQTDNPQLPTMVLLHGGGTWSYSFRELIPLLQTHYHMVIVDLPGFGRSLPLQAKFKDYSLKTVSKNLQELILKILALKKQNSHYSTAQQYEQQNLTETKSSSIIGQGLQKEAPKAHYLQATQVDRSSSNNDTQNEPVTILGHSWGGGLGIAYALTYPQQVKNLILIASSGLDAPDTWDWELFRIKGLGRLMTYLIYPFTVKMDLKKAFYNDALIDDEMVQETYWPLRQKQTKRAIYYYSQKLNWKWTEKKLSEIKTNTLIIWGRQDQFLPVKYSFQLKEKIPNSTLAIFDKCGHQIHEECAEPVANTILKYLQP